MNRLTNQFGQYIIHDINGNGECLGCKTISNDATIKLCSLENIEERFGIELTVLDRMLRNGFYAKNSDGEAFYLTDSNNGFVCFRDLGYDAEICYIETKNEINAPITRFLEFSLYNYGKYFAETKEELENDQDR